MHPDAEVPYTELESCRRSHLSGVERDDLGERRGKLFLSPPPDWFGEVSIEGCICVSLTIGVVVL